MFPKPLPYPLISTGYEPGFPPGLYVLYIMTESSTFKSPIPDLTDDNYPEWLIDIKALLRKLKLWEYTQSGPDPDKSGPVQAKIANSNSFFIVTMS